MANSWIWIPVGIGAAFWPAWVGVYFAGREYGRRGALIALAVALAVIAAMVGLALVLPSDNGPDCYTWEVGPLGQVHREPC